MYKHILIATTARSWRVTPYPLASLWVKALKAQVTVVTVTEPWSAMVIGEPALAFPMEDYVGRRGERRARPRERGRVSQPRTPVLRMRNCP